MTDHERFEQANDLLRDAFSDYASIVPGARGRYPELRTQLAIAEYLRLLVKSHVGFYPAGHVMMDPKP